MIGSARVYSRNARGWARWRGVVDDIGVSRPGAAGSAELPAATILSRFCQRRVRHFCLELATIGTGRRPEAGAVVCARSVAYGRPSPEGRLFSLRTTCAEQRKTH